MIEGQPTTTKRRQTDPPASSNSRLKGLLKGALVVAVLGFSVWYILANTDPDELGQALAGMHPGWTIAGVLATLAAHLARSQRWRLLIPDGGSIPLLNAFSATMIGYMMNNIIPRSGELLRPLVLAGRERRSVASLLATILVERLLDGITLLMLILLLMVTERSTLERVFVGYSVSGILMGIIIPLGALVAAMVVVWKTSLGERLLGWIGRRLPAHIAARLLALPEEFRAGVGVKGFGAGMIILLWTIVIWGGYAVAIYCGFLAFGFDTGYGLGAAQTIPMLVVTAVATTLAPTPGAIGVYHAFCIAALTALFGVPEGKAAAFAIITHAAPYLAVMATGALFFLREDISFRDAFTRGGIAPR